MKTEEVKYKILLVDDEQDIVTFLKYNLVNEGYEVFSAQNGNEAIKIARQVKPHVIILDVMMPELDGIETCRILRYLPETKDAYIVFLSALGQDENKIEGLEAGSDDYIAKPVNPKVFVNRINAIVRRLGHAEDKEPVDNKLIVRGKVTIDPGKYAAIMESGEVVLPKKEFELLKLLASSPNKVVRREKIYEEVWGNDIVVGDRTIDVHIRKIRQKTGLDNIVTIKGVGYMYKEDVV